jgi:acyl-CoA synthetase (AMP-forming)/AMP-acid ligase II
VPVRHLYGLSEITAVVTITPRLPEDERQRWHRTYGSPGIGPAGSTAATQGSGHRSWEGSPFFFITGRLKELITRGGVNSSPLEVDAVLRSHPQSTSGSLCRSRTAATALKKRFAEDLAKYRDHQFGQSDPARTHGAVRSFPDVDTDPDQRLIRHAFPPVVAGQPRAQPRRQVSEQRPPASATPHRPGHPGHHPANNIDVRETA